MNAKRQRLREIMSELQSGMTRTRERIKRPDRSLVRYHGPYADFSGERFYLPQKWRHGGKDNEWHECNFDYVFKKDKMNSTDLMRNLHWLGQSNKIMKLANDDSDNVVDLEEDDNSDDEGGELVGRGIQQRPITKKRKNSRCHR